MNQREDQRVLAGAQDIDQSFRSGETTVQVLQNASIQVRSHELAALTGRSGSGKTSLLQILGLLARPVSGSVDINGESVAGLSGKQLATLRATSIGFVFQSLNLLPQHSALDNVIIPWRGNTGAGRERAAQLLEQVGLGGRAHHRPDQLSGGEQQRVAVARALINDPPLILADEPTGNLDVENEQLLMDVFADLAAAGKGVLLITHSADVAARADVVWDLTAGRTAVRRRRGVHQ